MGMIKFRAWYENVRRGEKKGEEIVWSIKSYYDYKPIIDNGGLLEVEGCDIYGNSDENYVIEQYTGLKDNNGKEIYEGDIVTVSPEFEPRVEDIHTGEVFFAIGYGAYMIDFHDYDLNNVLLAPTIVDKRVIVIGNIHENKELLK